MLLFSPAILAADPPQGTVVCWGYYMGYDDAPGSLKVLKLAGKPVTNAIAIAAGDNHALALRNDGTVVGWGANTYDQAVGYSLTNSDRATGVVRIDGEVLSDVVAIAAGVDHSLALKADSTVVGWGSHVVPTGLSNIASIATGYNYSMGVKTDGTVICLGGGDRSIWRATHSGYSERDYASIFLGVGDSRIVEGLSNAVAAAVLYGQHSPSMALKTNGTVVEISIDKKVARTFGASNVIAITGGREGLFLMNDGTVVGRDPTADVPAGLSNVVAIAAGPRHNLALKKDGSVTMWGGPFAKQLAVPTNLSNVVAVSVGMDFFLAITTNTTLTATNK